MPRQIDLELLALALAAGAVAAWVVARRNGGRVGVLAVLGGLILAVLADRAWVHAVPRDTVSELGATVIAVAVAALVGWGATRLPLTPPLPMAGLPPVLPLVLASLVGVWAGVPETSVTLVVAGVVGGLAAVVVARRLVLTMPGAVVVSMAPVGAALIGAVGSAQAVVGGCLCSATFVVLAFGPRLRSVSAPALVRGTAVHLVAALIAARQIGIRRDWSTAPLWVPVVIGLAVVATRQLRRSPQAGGGP